MLSVDKAERKMGIMLLSHFGATKIFENDTNIFVLRISRFKECDQIAMK